MSNPTVPEVLKFLAAIAHDAELEYEEHKKNKNDKMGDVVLWRMCVYNSIIGADLGSNDTGKPTIGAQILEKAVSDNRAFLKELPKLIDSQSA